MNIEDIIDRRPLGTFQIRVAALCGLVVFMAGFNTQAIGYVVPAIIDDWAIDRAAFAPVFAAGLTGIMIGALICGPLADRIGRRPILIGCVLWFGVMSSATTTATSINELLLFRLLTGFGIGGALPNAIALTSEYTPRRQRTTASMVMFCGFSFGAATAGFTAAALTTAFGWVSIFLVGGVVPCAATVPLLLLLPESIRYLSDLERGKSQVARILAAIDPGLQTTVADAFVVEREAHPRFPVAQLFSGGRLRITLLVWVLFFMSLLVLHFVTAWLPTIVRDAGVPLDRAVLITATFQMGALAAALPLGRLLDRYPPFRTLGLVYLAAGVVVVLLGVAGSSVSFLFAASFGAGLCILGGQLGANALAAQVYPTSARATGVGWALGVGRIGSIVGPVVGGWLLSLNWESRALFTLAAVPAILAAAAAFGLNRTWRGPPQETTTNTTNTTPASCPS